MERKHKVNGFISRTTTALGSIPAVIIAVSLVLSWALCGPIFKFSEAWQLTINTGTTIITFLMVFIIQNSQNRDGRAMQAKLDYIIDTLGGDADLMTIEDKTEKEIKDKDEEIIKQSSKRGK